MSWKRRLLATLGAFVAIFAMEFVIHHVWLSDFYKAHAEWWRPEAEMKSMLHLMWLAQIVLAALLTTVYAKGYEVGKGSLAQGARFGFLIGLLLMLPSSLVDYVVYPYPVSLVASWFVGGVAEITLAGVVIGALYRPESE